MLGMPELLRPRHYLTGTLASGPPCSIVCCVPGSATGCSTNTAACTDTAVFNGDSPFPSRITQPDSSLTCSVAVWPYAHVSPA